MHGGRTMGKHSEVFVAFDVAKKKHAMAIAEGGRTGEVRFLGDVENSPPPIEGTIKRLADRYNRLHICFEAGPTGCGLYRQVKALGHDCMVVAPASIPKRSGDYAAGFTNSMLCVFRSVKLAFLIRQTNTNANLEDRAYRTPLLSEVKTYELTAPPLAGAKPPTRSEMTVTMISNRGGVSADSDVDAEAALDP
jgi:hypothetical protein